MELHIHKLSHMGCLVNLYLHFKLDFLVATVKESWQQFMYIFNQIQCKALCIVYYTTIDKINTIAVKGLDTLSVSKPLTGGNVSKFCMVFKLLL